MTTRTVVTEFKWALNDFKHRFMHIDGTANSEIFPLNGGSEAQFQVKILSNCHIHLFCRKFGQAKQINLNAEFWIESAGKKLGKSVQSRVFKKSGNIVKSKDFLPYDLYKVLNSQIEHGRATICLKIQQEVPVHEVDSRESIGEAILSLHDDGTLVTIKAEEKEIKILKGFLIHHSEVFKKMLSIPNSIEAQSGVISIENVSAIVIEAMRNWMYTIKIENFDEIALALFQIAHKYGIVGLKEKSVDSMSRGLTWENVPSRLILAQKYTEDLLKQHTLEFIRNDIGNLRHLMMSDEWMEFCGSNPEVAKEIVASI